MNQNNSEAILYLEVPKFDATFIAILVTALATSTYLQRFFDFRVFYYVTARVESYIMLIVTVLAIHITIRLIMNRNLLLNLNTKH